MSKLKENCKKFFSNKWNIIALMVIIVIILIILFSVLFLGRDNGKNKFALSAIYDVYPEDVKNLYSNVVSVNCSGDLLLDIDLGVGKVSVDKLSNSNKLDYLFSYLAKQDKLSDKFDVNVVKEASKNLFSKEIDLVDAINNYQNVDYTYSIKGNQVVREQKKCTVSKIKYVSHLYGFSNNEKILSVDINIGYTKDGVLYDMADKELGKYNGEVEKLEDLFGPNSYYRFNYIKDGDIFKLDSVEWNNRV